MSFMSVIANAFPDEAAILDGDLLVERFEGSNSGYDLVWTTGGSGGTFDPDYVTNVLQGSQSLRITHSAQSTFRIKTITSQSTRVFMFFRMMVLSGFGGSHEFIGFQNSGSSTSRGHIALTSGASPLLRCLAAGGTNNVSTDIIPLNTHIRVWADYLKNQGSNNGTMRAGWSLDGTKPTFTAGGAKTCISANGTNTDNIDRIRVGPAGNETDDLVIDDIHVATFDLGNRT